MPSPGLFARRRTAMPRVLTDRQADVLRLVCAGATPAEITAALEIRPITLYHHRQHIRARLGVCDLAEACSRCPDDLAAAEERAKRRAQIV
jgi:DNA-binding CsgD family transcriptional regulator